MSKILCAGSAGKDIFFPTKEGQIIETPKDLTSQKKIAFELGEKYKIGQRHEALGGCAANVAVGLVKLGIEASCVSQIGDDEIGKWIRQELQKNKVNVDMLATQAGKKSDMSAIVVDETSADRVIFSNKNSSGKIELNKEKIQEAEWILLGDIHGKWKEQMGTIFQLADNYQKRVAFNPRGSHIREDPAEIIEAIALCEIVFVNKDEAIEIVSSMHNDVSFEMMNNEKFLLEKLSKLEPKVVVLTDGERGAWASNGKNIFYSPAEKVKAVDSTGAGDSFLAGFLAAYIKEKEIIDCLKWGIVNSASEVQYFGAIDGLLEEKEIIEKAQNIKTETIQ